MAESNDNIQDDSAEMINPQLHPENKISSYEQKYPPLQYDSKALEEDIRHKFQILTPEDVTDSGYKGYLHSIQKCPTYFIVAIFLLTAYCIYDIFYWTKSINVAGTDLWEYLAINKNASEKSRAEGLYVAINELNDQLLEMEIMPPRTVLEPAWETHVIFELKLINNEQGDIFTAQRIIRMRQIINNIKVIEGTNDFCIAESEFNSQCSDTEFIQGAIFEFKEKLEDTQILEKKSNLTNDPSMLQFLQNKMKQGQDDSQITRVILRYATPIKKLTNRSNFTGQQTEFNDYMKRVYQYVKSIDDTELSVYIYSDALYKSEYDYVIYDDAEYMSLAFAWLCISLFIASRGVIVVLLALIQLAISFLAGYMIYSEVFFISDVGPLLIFGAYIVMTLALNNLLIFRDTWRHSKFYLEDGAKLHERMAWVFNRAIKEILIITIVVCLSVLPLIYTTIYQIRIFLAFIIIMSISLLLSSIVLYPPLFIFYKKYLSKPFNLIRQLKKQMNLTHQIEMDLGAIEIENKVDDEEDIKSLKSGKTEKFFGTICTKITLYIGPIILISMCAFVGYSLYVLVENINIRSEPDQLLPYKFKTQYALKLLRESFKRGLKDMHPNIYIYWGVHNLINTNSSTFSKSRGVIEYDPLFEVEFFKGNTIMDICELCRNLQASPLINNPQYLSCFAIEFTNYLYSLKKRAKDENVCTIYSEFNDIEKRLITWATKTSEGMAFTHSHEIGITTFKKIKFAHIVFPLRLDTFANLSSIEQTLTQAHAEIKLLLAQRPNKLVSSAKVSGMYYELFVTTAGQLKLITALGMGLSVTALFFLLIFATCNPLLAVYAVICSASIFIAMIPSLSIFSNQFSTMEAVFSLSIPLFSISPFVITSVEYMLSAEERRRFRLRDALAQSAVTQFQVSIMIMGNTLWLYLCDCILLYKFAIYVFIGVTLAFVYGLMFFPALLNFIGPFRKCCKIPYSHNNRVMHWIDEWVCRLNCQCQRRAVERE